VIKAAIDRILTLAPPCTFREGDRTYVDKVLHPVQHPEPRTMAIHTLTGLVDYVENHHDEDLKGQTPFFRVVSHKEVLLCSSLQGPFRQRTTFLAAEPPENRGYPFGQWLDPETFIINLQAMFVQDEVTASLLALVTSIKEEQVRTSADDGVSQAVTAKAGVALVTEVKIPNPVSLRPYRTFLEVEQPAISCVFRLRQGPMLSLHEADGGLWRLEVIKSIKEYLTDEMDGLGQKIPVIA
jgi:hypothetical protein